MPRTDRTSFNIWLGETKPIGIEITYLSDGTDFLPTSATVTFYKKSDDSVVALNVVATVTDNEVAVNVPSDVYNNEDEYYAIWKITRVVSGSPQITYHPSDIVVRSMEPDE